MAKMYDLTAIAEGDRLRSIAFSNNPDVRRPNYKDAAMAISDNETRVVGIRFPVELLDWIDRYSRNLAVDKDKRVTRNQVVVSFLEKMKADIESTKETTH